jgi:hypothetical protein
LPICGRELRFSRILLTPIAEKLEGWKAGQV